LTAFFHAKNFSAMKTRLDEIWKMDLYSSHDKSRGCNCPACAALLSPNSSQTLLDEMLYETHTDIPAAVAYNRKNADRLGWGKHLYDIVEKVLRVNYSPEESHFAELVAEWQATQGLTSNGKLGPETWATMKPLLTTGTSASQSGPVSTFDEQEIRKIFAFLGYDLQQKSMQQVIRDFQGDMSLGVTGKLDIKTESKLRELAQQIKIANAKSNPIRRLSRFRLTNYYVADETDYANNPLIPVLADSGQTLAWVDPAFFLSMSVEGTGRLRNGTLLNVTGNRIKVGSFPVYQKLLETAAGKYPVTDSNIKYTGVSLKNKAVESVLAFHEVPKSKIGKGYGTIRSIALDPFFTLAADIGAFATSDPRFCKRGGLVPPGTKVFILEYVGKKLPDGRVHDGWFTVNDTGSAIYGAHFDVFAGSRQLAKQLWKPHIGHVWFDTSEQRCPPQYDYGLTKNEKVSSQCQRK